ncbi:MAG: DUF5320 domain-containing protein [Patescibacteria group bacterium]
MPRMNGTGPAGQGPMTGRGRGNCQNGERKFWCGRRFGFGFKNASLSTEEQITALDEEEKIINEELKAIKDQKELLKKEK